MDYIPSWERSAHRKGIREGMERGIERGIERKARETAIKLLNKGYDIAFVCEVTGLNREEVIRLSENEVTTH
ncbi:MAG: transposase [Acidobacteria bacterium]|nr:transposase [Acidobacteriota bacterium]